MGKTVTLRIDGQAVSVPENTLVVDAAKMIDIDIPVFCYHPKMAPVGMCRMCLVSIGRPARDRATNLPLLEDDGSPKIAFNPKLETACTTPVSEGMVVVTASEQVAAARKEMLEFLLTSHPLDCPICDKGGECPLQNLTMGFGPGESRFLLDEKMRLAKQYPLGELILLDRERCIQCGRCVRFQSDIAGDPVIAFTQRGRALEITTYSQPGFDSYFSGNTTDICPVGALTTVDFRFRARPWELNYAAGICNHCPVGCNLTYNVRREVSSGGGMAIKRVMPRQNEQVNEIWICDKGRFAYQYAESPQRLKHPLVRRDGKLVETTWEEALARAAALFSGDQPLVTLAGGRLANEDLFNLRQFTTSLGGKAVLDTYMAGGDLTALVGLSEGSNFGAMGAETAILVVACDVHEEAPVWYLRLKQAAARGAKLIVVNARPTKLDRNATHLLRYAWGRENDILSAFFPGESGSQPDELRAAVEVFSEAQNAVILFGSDGIGLAASRVLAHSCAKLLVATRHIGRPNNGLVGVWHSGNLQGAWDMGFRPVASLSQALSTAGALYVVAADPLRDQPALLDLLAQKFLVVQDLFLTETARHADVVLPALPLTEREGSLTSGERRVQRSYPALPARGGLPDFVITAQIARLMGVELEARYASLVLLQIAEQIPAYAGMTYQKLAEVTEQWPIIGRQDLYYGGTGYDNHQGLGVPLTTAASRGEGVHLPTPPQYFPDALPPGALAVVPVKRLYDHSNVMLQSALLKQRLTERFLALHPETALQFGLADGETVTVRLDGVAGDVVVRLDAQLQAGVALLPRSAGLPIDGSAFLKLAERQIAGDPAV
jgi:NADH-quinone oxidoreductase subunit G